MRYIFERFYLSFLFIPTLLLTLWNIRINKPTKAILTTLFLASIAWYLSTNNINLSTCVSYIQGLRVSYSAFSDVNYAYNYNIPYPLAVIKIAFTPFFTFNKFNLFYDYSYILIWGSIIHQLTMLISTWSLFLNIKENFYKHLTLTISFILFMLICAYVSPWSGRLRDSFYPLIAAYAGHCIYIMSQNNRLKKYFLKN